MTRSIYVVIACLAGACSSAQPRVQVLGAPSDLAALAGDWAGDYSSAESGRSGSIRFTLRAQSDSAFGDVVMVPAGWGQPLVPWREVNASAAPRSPSEVLTINFVRAQGNRVSGTLAPYADPVTGARLLTTFVGEINGSTIGGTYTTRLPSGETQQGRWTVQRH